MKLFYWNKNFETGVTSIDTQHKVLVNILNKLGNAVTTYQELPLINQLLDELHQYTQVHFSDEEAIMSASNMPDEEQIAHKQQHQKFIQQLADVKLHPDEFNSDTTQKLLQFLTTWLISHILGSDMEVARYANPCTTPTTNLDEEYELEVSKIEHTLLQALNESERRFRFLTDHTPAIIWASDVSGNRIFFNSSWYSFIGSSSEQWLDFVHPADQVKYSTFIEHHLNERSAASCEYRLKSKGGSYHYFLEKIIPRIHDGHTFYGFISSAIDITQLKNAEQALLKSNDELELEVAKRTADISKIAVTDALTGLGNRRYFDDLYPNKLAIANRYQNPLTLVYLDIDHFKRINDELGHKVGDKVLVELAIKLKDIFRNCDILARIGGEEFVALLPNTTVAKAEIVCQRILHACKKLTFSEIDWPITVSIGVAQAMNNESETQLLNRADNAMYRSKRNGRNQYTLCFNNF